MVYKTDTKQLLSIPTLTRLEMRSDPQNLEDNLRHQNNINYENNPRFIPNNPYNEPYPADEIMEENLLEEHNNILEHPRQVLRQLEHLDDRELLYMVDIPQPIMYGEGFLGVENNPHQRPENQTGIHAIEINPSQTRLATVAQNSRDIAIYNSDTLDPLYIGTTAHSDKIFDMCWMDDQFVVSGSRDKQIALWKIDSDDRVSSKASECSNNINKSSSYYNSGFVPYEEVSPVMVKKCKNSSKVRSVLFNSNTLELITLSTLPSPTSPEGRG